MIRGSERAVGSSHVSHHPVFVCICVAPEAYLHGRNRGV